MPKKVVGAKIACLDFNLMKTKMKLGVQVLVDDPEKLEAIRKRESDITSERIKKILDAGANVVLTTQVLSDVQFSVLRPYILTDIFMTFPLSAVVLLCTSGRHRVCDCHQFSVPHGMVSFSKKSFGL